MIRKLAYSIIATLFVACALMSMATGQGGVHEFDVSAPDTFLDFVSFVPALLVDFVQFMFSCVTWDFAPNLPHTLRIVLVALSTVPVVAVFFMDIVPAIANAVGKLIDVIPFL